MLQGLLPSSSSRSSSSSIRGSAAVGPAAAAAVAQAAGGWAKMSEIYANEPVTSGKVVLHTTMGPLDVELWSRRRPFRHGGGGPQHLRRSPAGGIACGSVSRRAGPQKPQTLRGAPLEPRAQLAPQVSLQGPHGGGEQSSRGSSRRRRGEGGP
ncbi:hypothetical protein Esti_005384 [Eimeria stiedai]